MKVNKIKGTLDYFGYQLNAYRYIESVARRVCANHGINELMLPTFEATELFARGVGEGSDIVSKEMYTFQLLDIMFYKSLLKFMFPYARFRVYSL